MFDWFLEINGVFTRFRVRFALLTVAFVAVVGLHPGLARAAGVDFWNLADARADLDAETEHAAVLADRDDAILRRIVIKENLAAELAAGRTNLAAVAARFLDLSADDTTYLNVLRTSIPGDSDLERAARNVIDYTERCVPDGADRAALRARLDAELERLQDADHPTAR